MSELNISETNNQIDSDDNGYKKLNLFKNTEKFGNVKKDIQSFTNSITNKAQDLLKSKNNRQQQTDSDFNQKEVSTSNRHTDAIESILNNTFNGNLWDVGVQSLNLYNYGTKWRISTDLNINKEVYPFKYYYYTLNSESSLGTETNISYFDKIDDPTILGFTCRINFDTSPLFTQLDYGAFNFIERYTNNNNLPELSLCKSYLTQFKQDISRIFENPEIGNLYREQHKNFYITEIKNLNLLDNKFVKYNEKDNEHESLEFILNEDVKLYINRLAILYRNLSWSYNMGKKLLPENLLRFDLYIKISDMRTFTGVNYKDIIENDYSRIIYELKDCEFLFPESSLSSSIKNGGNQVPTDSNYNTVSFKIKYRKVNRYFYSKMFPEDGKLIHIISDKRFKPNTEKSFPDIEKTKFIGINSKRRTSMSNNIEVVNSLSSTFNRLKQKGLLTDKEDDSAVGKYAKGLGNKAIKKGAGVIDDGLQSVKTKVNDFGKNVKSIVDNNIPKDIQGFLLGDLEKQTSKLGNLHNNDIDNDLLKTRNTNIRKEQVLNPVINTAKNINTILHNNIDNNIDLNEQLHNNVDNTINLNEQLHTNVDNNIDLNEQLHTNVDNDIELNEQLHTNVDNNIDLNEQLHTNVDNTINLNEQLHNNVDNDIELNEQLHTNVENIIEINDINLHKSENGAFNKYKKNDL